MKKLSLGTSAATAHDEAQIMRRHRVAIKNCTGCHSDFLFSIGGGAA